MNGLGGTVPENAGFAGVKAGLGGVVEYEGRVLEYGLEGAAVKFEAGIGANPAGFGELYGFWADTACVNVCLRKINIRLAPEPEQVQMKQFPCE